MLRPMSTTPDRTPEGWDEASEGYDAAIARFTRLYAEEAVEAAGVGPGMEVLDVAAGSGAATLAAAERGARVLATDFAPRMLERLRERAEGNEAISTQVMDGQALDLPDEGFDAVTSVFGVIFFPDRVRGFSEMRRVLKPGGVASVMSWSVPERVPMVSVFGEAVRTANPGAPPPAEPPAVFSLSDPELFESELRAGGFADVRIQPITKTWELGTPEQFWDSFQGASPVVSDQSDPAAAEAVREAFVRIARDRYGENVRIDAEALLAVARK